MTKSTVALQVESAPADRDGPASLAGEGIVLVDPAHRASWWTVAAERGPPG
jgi:hypothetical protein